MSIETLPNADDARSRIEQRLAESRVERIRELEERITSNIKIALSRNEYQTLVDSNAQNWRHDSDAFAEITDACAKLEKLGYHTSITYNVRSSGMGHGGGSKFNHRIDISWEKPE